MELIPKDEIQNYEFAAHAPRDINNRYYHEIMKLEVGDGLLVPEREKKSNILSQNITYWKKTGKFGKKEFKKRRTVNGDSIIIRTV